MPADFPYVLVSGLHLWQAFRTAQSTRRFGVRGVTCTTCLNVTDRNRMSQKWSHRPQTMPADFPYVLVRGPHLLRSPRTARSTRRLGGSGGHMHSMHIVCIKFIYSMHNVCITYVIFLHQVCFTIPLADHKVCTKCARCRLCRLGAHSTQPVTGLLGWSVGQHMAHELM